MANHGKRQPHRVKHESQFWKKVLIGILAAGSVSTGSATNAFAAPEPVSIESQTSSTPGRIEEATRRLADERLDQESDLDFDPDELLSLISDKYGIENSRSTSDVLEAWAGLTAPATHATYRQILRNAEEAVARQAGSTLGDLDVPSRMILNAKILGSFTPDAALRLGVDEETQDPTWDSLVQFVRSQTVEAANSSGRGLGNAREPFRQGSSAEVDVLEEIAESQRALADVLKKAQEGPVQSDWGKLLKEITPAALAGHLLATFIEAASKAVLDYTKRAAHDVKRWAEGKDSAGKEVAADVQTDAGFASVKASLVPLPDSPQKLIKIETYSEQLLMLGVVHDLNPAMVAKVREQVERDMRQALEGAPAGAPATTASAVSQGFEELVDRVV